MTLSHHIFLIIDNVLNEVHVLYSLPSITYRNYFIIRLGEEERSFIDIYILSTILIVIVDVAVDVDVHVSHNAAPNEHWLLRHALLRRKDEPAPLALVVVARAEGLKEFINVIILRPVMRGYYVMNVTVNYNYNSNKKITVNEVCIYLKIVVLLLVLVLVLVVLPLITRNEKAEGVLFIVIIIGKLGEGIPVRNLNAA